VHPAQTLHKIGITGAPDLLPEELLHDREIALQQGDRLNGTGEFHATNISAATDIFAATDSLHPHAVSGRPSASVPRRCSVDGASRAVVGTGASAAPLLRCTFVEVHVVVALFIWRREV
jgi:hypothetical protein